MEHFQIPNFRPTETKTDASDADRTVLRRAEGVVAVPLGTLSGGPTWKPLWGLSTLGTQIAAALSGANASNAHFVTVTRGDHTLLVCWSLARSEPLGIFHVAGSESDTSFDSTSGVSITAPSSAPYRDHSGQLPWFMSTLGSRIVLGNGTGANLTFSGGTLSAWTPDAPSTIYEPGREAFPPCTSFVVGPGRHVFATGNVTYPLRVWIGRPANDTETEVTGVYDDETSKIDILLSGATRATALSVWQSYVTVHTDKGAVNLFTVDENVSSGTRVRQAASPVNSAAPNPRCAYDPNGHGPFYLGADGEIYSDQSTRTGPYGKKLPRDLDIATAEAAGDWNQAMVTPVDTRYSATLFDRQQKCLWVFTRTIVPSDRTAVWCYAERADAPSGPFRYPNAVAVGAFRTFGTRTVAIVVTGAGELLYADLSLVTAVEAWEVDAPGTALGAAYDYTTGSAPTPSAGIPYVGINAAGTGFAQVVAGKRIELATPWSEWAETSSLTLTRYLNNAHLGIVELGYLDLGRGDLLKHWLEVQATFRPQSRAWIGVFCETERGVRSGKWYPRAVFTREHAKVAINLVGPRVRVRLLVLWFNDQRGELRELSVGYNAVGDR